MLAPIAALALISSRRDTSAIALAQQRACWESYPLIKLSHTAQRVLVSIGESCGILPSRAARPRAIDAVIVELLLVEIVGCQAELEDRNARGVVLDEFIPI